MNMKVGDLVKHPNAPEWGMGFVRHVDGGGAVTVLFTKAGSKTLLLNKLPFSLERVPPGRSTTIMYHREFLEGRGIPYRGVRPPESTRRHRITHCYNCKSNLDNSLDIECIACSWILCHCGACGCGYNQARF